jgi:tRNA(Ile)-lysidine synthase
MVQVVRRVSDFIAQHQLLVPNAHVLVALSGGADSVALLRILMRLGYRCHAVHCNFHLRGEESNRDERFVVSLCESLNVPCEVVHFDTQTYAADRRVSIEMAARELRYREFERVRETFHLDAIAVAHHQDDAVETFLLNLIRGAGINGLTGMRMRNGYVVRPLLCLTRSEVLGFLDASGQSYVTDSTNLTDEYARNKVRLHLLPLMQQINLSAATNIMQAANHLADAATIYNGVIADNSSRVVTSVEDGVDVSIASLMETEVPKAQLFEILHPYGFNSRQVADVFRAMLGDGVGRMFYADDYVLLIDRTSIMLRRRNGNREVSFTLPHEGVMTLPDGARLEIRRFVPDASWQVPRHCGTCVLDASRFVSPLTLRHPCEGDRFRPFGLKGTKLLSDLYTDIKLDRIAKQRQWVLCHDDDIVWAVGVRASELCRLQGDEQEVVEITYHPAID